jgi:hypothetical protein
MSGHTQLNDASRSRPRRWSMTFLAVVAGVVAVLKFATHVSLEDREPVGTVWWSWQLDMAMVRALDLSFPIAGIGLLAATVAFLRGEDYPAVLMVALLFCAVPIGLFVTLLGPFILMIIQQGG